MTNFIIISLLSLMSFGDVNSGSLNETTFTVDFTERTVSFGGGTFEYTFLHGRDYYQRFDLSDGRVVKIHQNSLVVHGDDPRVRISYRIVR